MSPTLKLVLPLALASVAVIAFAQTRPTAPAAPAPAASDAAIRAAVTKAIPGVQIDGIKPSVIPGYREVALGSRVAYVSQDGKYLIQGSLVQLDTRINLTEASEAKLRRVMLAAVGPERRIVFGPADPKYRVTVFTDIDCSYCRRLHAQMADYNKAGIAIEYLFFPRHGIGSETYVQAINVWCSADRRKALTDAKSDRPLPTKSCANPIDADYKLALNIGADGTPAVYAADGNYLGGYLSPADMLAKLDRLAALGQPVKSK